MVIRSQSNTSRNPDVYDPYQPFAPAIRDNPYPLYHELRSKDPVHYSERLRMWLLTRYSDVALFLRDNDRFAAGPKRVEGLFQRFTDEEKEALTPQKNIFSMWSVFNDPPNHTRLRALISHAFTSTASERARPMIEKVAASLVDAVRDRQNFDVIGDIAYPLPVIVIAELLGMPTEDREKLKAWSDDIVPVMARLHRSFEQMKKGQDSMVEMGNYVRRVLEERKKNPADDLLSRLISVREEGHSLTEDEIVATASMLLFAGHETTTHLIGNGTLALLRNPGEIQRLVADPELIPSAVEEMLRYDSPANWVVRIVKEEVIVDGKTLSPGQKVLLFVGAANRDPSVFPEPDRFDISRRDNRHVAFGQGIHFCVGAPLARLETMVYLRLMLPLLPRLRLATEALQWTDDGIRGVRSLPVVLT